MLRLRDGVWARARTQVDDFLFLTTTVILPKLAAHACLRAQTLGAAVRSDEWLPASPVRRSLAKHAPLAGGALLACMAIFSGESPQPLAGATAQALPPVQKDPTRLINAPSDDTGTDAHPAVPRDFGRSFAASAGHGLAGMFEPEPLWPHGHQLWIALNAFRVVQPTPRDVLQERAPEPRQPIFASAAWTYAGALAAVLPVRAEPESRGEAPQVETGESESAGYVGLWGPDASACSPRTNRSGLLPAVINSEGAFAGETSCRFDGLKRTAAGWQSLARCASGEERWSSKVRLTLSGDHLVWASERGSQTYVRCGQALL